MSANASRISQPPEKRTCSTPIIWGDRVFLTQSMNGGKRRTLLCLDRRTGNTRWQSGVDATEMEPTHKTNPYCSPSPVTDGERVIVWYGNLGLVAYDFSGKDSSSLAVRVGGKGDVTRSHELWKVPRARSRLGTGVIHIHVRTHATLWCLGQDEDAN